MPPITRGFQGRRREADDRLPPGQYLTDGFPVLSAGPTPHTPLDQWTFTDRRRAPSRSSGPGTSSWRCRGKRRTSTSTASPAGRSSTPTGRASPWTRSSTRSITTPRTRWRSATAATRPTSRIEDLTGDKAWVAFGFDGEPLDPEHGGPARLLVPHLYFWKSAKWVRGLRLLDEDEPGFWETNGYHLYGDPWREQRYWGD